MKKSIYLILGFASVLCMGALTKPTMKTLALPHWRVDANLTGGNFDLGTADQTAYISMTNSAITLTNNSGQGVLTAQVPCSSTNASSGTTCSAGTEDNGIAFTIPADGCALSASCDMRVCVSFSHAVTNGASGIVSSTFQIVETPNNAQTISQEGKSRVNSRTGIVGSISFGLMVCGTFTYTAAAQKTFRLMYEQDTTASVSGNEVPADAASTLGQRDVHWEAYPILAY